jgi:peptide/nickel transport system permease protein
MQYAFQRVIALLLMLVVVTIATFTLMRLLPGDPALALYGLSGEGVTQADLQRTRADLGLNRPLPVQYVTWISHIARGDLGRSAITRQPVDDTLAVRLPVTLQLAVGSFVLAVLIGMPVGILAAYYRGSIVDGLVTAVGLLGVAIPGFWFGILLIIFFGVKLAWLPPSGYVSLGTDPGSAIKHLLLPCIALGVPQAAVLMRQTRSSLLEVLASDYVRTARSKGLKERTVVVRHALRSGMLPVVTVMAVIVAHLLGGSIVIETVFAMPGLGAYAVQAIFSRDYVVIQAIVLITTAVVLLSNSTADIAYGLLDPRTRQ